ncbi:hypothetical protein DS901_11415 [Loktanella sp. D2R18]|uniref:hypothetical protein n=1 Tax=Rhodobacterales TaxID=204455 RepID=UPI000DEA156F|nr:MULTISPECIES: hypothetical protein [Rhodobacterales]MDO6590347.1 hypothetical protein [Yoonia sp. 1_MG-2023]RBW42852.1 hypothetical protein DS901_11415 [Loktanella sp. D2R18]
MFNAFIIIETDPIVIMDLTGLLSADYPSSRIDAPANNQDIASTIAQSGPNTVIIIKDALLRDYLDPIKSAATRGNRIAILGNTTDIDLPAITIEMPFTQETIIGALCSDVQEASRST